MYITNNPKPYSLAEIAKLTNSELIGDAQATATGFAPYTHPAENCLSFSKDKKLQPTTEHSKLAGLFIGMETVYESSTKLNLLKTKDPQKALIKAIELIYQAYQAKSSIAGSACIHPSAQLGENVEIHPNVHIAANVKIGSNVCIMPNCTIYQDAIIGDNTFIHSNVTIREYTQIGKFNVIQSGVQIGTDGFGYMPDPEQGLLRVPQIGKALTGDFVEIGANSCIDRGALGDTVIGMGTKIDNLVQIAHNVTIGNFSIICGQAGIAGSCNIGSQVVIGGQVGVSGHVSICDGARFAGGTIVRKAITEPGDYAGDPCIPIKQWRKNFVKGLKA